MEIGRMAEDIQKTDIENRILVIRNQQVMIDRDIAGLYGVETRSLNQAVKRNKERFPDEFMFQLTEDEFLNLKLRIVKSTHKRESLISQSVISKRGGTQKLPYAFTEQGVAMLSAVLRSEKNAEKKTANSTDIWWCLSQFVRVREVFGV